MFAAWKFSIVFFFLVPLIAFSGILTVILTKKISNEELKIYGQASRIAQEYLSSVKTVASLCLEKRFLIKYNKQLKKTNACIRKKGLIDGLFRGISTMFFLMYFGGGVYYAVYLANVDCENYGNIENIIQALFNLINGSFSLIWVLKYFSELAEAKSAFSSIIRIIRTESKIDAYKSNGKILEILNGEIKFENLEFSYPQRPGAKILHGINFTIPAGKTVAIVGYRYFKKIVK